VSVYVIATAHDVYRNHEFPPGSVVIDPWRMIPDQRGVTVRRIGQNRPALISVLVPSRGRPDWLSRMLESLYSTATFTDRVEVVCWLDDDDKSLSAYWRLSDWPVNYLSGPRRLLSECWNVCAEQAKGEILMHCGDDLTFNTPGWDQMVRKEFAASEDKILFVHGDDLGPHGQEFGTHGFLHRRWVEAVGYFLPPLFSSDWNDVWLNEVAKMIGRRRLLPFVTEHWHYTFGKAERDKTHAEREERGIRDDVVNLYKRTQKERENDAAKLRLVMA
jgi:hypothetical protein